MEEFFGDVIHRYTRKMAIEDGVLIDVTRQAKDVGFKWPVAITSELKSLLEDIPPQFDYQSYPARLQDTLWMASMAARKSRGGDTLMFAVIMPYSKNTSPDEPHTLDNKKVSLKMVLSVEDRKPVLTIMLPHED